jgi:hypothetical protein
MACVNERRFFSQLRHAQVRKAPAQHCQHGSARWAYYRSSIRLRHRQIPWPMGAVPAYNEIAPALWVNPIRWECQHD